MSKNRSLLYVLAVVLVAVTGWWLWQQRESRMSQDAPPVNQSTMAMPKIAIGYSRLRISLPIFVAAENGLFKKHGLDVSLSMYDTAQPLMQSLVEGRIVAGGYTALPITYSAMLRSHTDLLFLTAIVEDQQHRISYLLKASKSPIKSIRDLKGKRVGILPTVAYKAWLEAILTENGVNPQDVVIQQIEPSLQAQTLAAGGIDALFTNDPAATAGILKAHAEFITDFVEVPHYLGEPFIFGSFNVRRDWAALHPKELAKLAASLNEAIGIINNQGVGANKFMKTFLPGAIQGQIARYPEALYLPTDSVKPEDFQKAASQYEKLKIIPEPLRMTHLVYTAGSK